MLTARIMSQSTQIAIAVVEHNGQFLVGERPAGVPLAGYAEFPGGKNLPGESATAAAERECLEETGVAVAAIGTFLSVDHAYEHGLLRLHFLDCRPVNAEDTPRSPFRWVSRSELAELKFPPANSNLLALLLS